MHRMGTMGRSGAPEKGGEEGRGGLPPLRRVLRQMPRGSPPQSCWPAALLPVPLPAHGLHSPTTHDTSESDDTERHSTGEAVLHLTIRGTTDALHSRGPSQTWAEEKASTLYVIQPRLRHTATITEGRTLSAKEACRMAACSRAWRADSFEKSSCSRSLSKSLLPPCLCACATSATC